MLHRTVLKVHEGQIDIVVPSFEEIKKYAVEKWKEGIGSMNPSFLPQKGDEYIIFQGSKNEKIPDAHYCVESAINLGLSLPNVHGLVLAEKLDENQNFLPPGSFLSGLDQLSHLYHKKDFGHMVPCLYKDYDGNFIYLSFKWDNLHELPFQRMIFFKPSPIII
jgi:hypothetical protein